jgi:vitamin B12 transporter
METTLVQLNAKMFDGLLDNTLTASRMDAEVTVRSDRYSASAPSRYWGDLQRYEYQGVLQPLEGHIFVFGADQERDHYRSHVRSSRENASLINSSVFGDYSIDLLDEKLTLGVGVRGYFHDTFGEHTTYRASASYRIPATGTRIHGSYATGFKAPTLKQALYNRDIAVGDGYSAIIDPEESQGYDLGVEQTLLGDRLLMDVAFFNTRLKNAIETNGAHGSGDTYYINVGSVRSMGVETSLDFDVTDEWQIGATYTYTQSRDNGTGQQMEEMPVHQGSVRVSYAPYAVSGLDTWVRMNAAGRSFDTVRGQGRVTLSGYATFDLGANYEINNTFSVYGRVENLFDEEYCQMAGFENAGIAAHAGVRAKF